MIYAYDKAATIPLVDVYDRLMMLAQIAAAKDMYEKGLEEMKEFKKDYGDILFSDPSSQEWYNNNFNVGKFLGELYKNGIDPLRSAEGRSLVSLYINSRLYGILNQLRANDANKKLYDASAAKLGTLYDEGYETWRLGYNPRTFRSVGPDGTINTFDAQYAAPYTNLHDMVHPTLAAIKPHLLTSRLAKSRLGDEYDPRNTYEGVTEEDMRNALQQYLPGIRNSMDYKYQRYLAEQDLLRRGVDPTPDKIDEQLVENAIMSDYGITTPLTQKADEWEMAEYDRNTKYNAARISAGITDPNQSIYSFQDDLYESGLKNMYGLDPETSLGTDEDGNQITMQKLSDNNPEFWREYTLRVLDASGNPYDGSNSVVKLLTHQLGSGLVDLPKRMGETELTKVDDTDLTGRHFYALSSHLLSDLITEDELNFKLINGVMPKDSKYPKGGVGDQHSAIKKVPKDVIDGASAETAAYRVNASTQKGVVTGFVDGSIRSYIPVYVYPRASDPGTRFKLYKLIDYKSVKSTGDSRVFNQNGVSTIYDGKYRVASQMSSSNVDKSMNVGANPIKSVSVDTPYR